jgi:hypothetical protein
MTHDELMAKVHSVFYEEEGGTQLDIKAANNQYRALYAVVNLHKPYQHEAVSYVFCMGCTIDLDLAPPYPCETIQTIERELE